MNFINYLYLIFIFFNVIIAQPNVDFFNTGLHGYDNRQLPTNLVSTYNTYTTNQNPNIYSETREYDFNKLFQSSNFNAVPSSASSYYSSGAQGNDKNSFVKTNSINDLPSVNTANLVGQDPNVLAQYLKYVESVQNIGGDNLEQLKNQNSYSSSILNENSQNHQNEQLLNPYLNNQQTSASSFQTPYTLPSTRYSVSSQTNVNYPSSSLSSSNPYPGQVKTQYVSPSSGQSISDSSKNVKTSYTIEYPTQPVYTGYPTSKVSGINNPSIYGGQEVNGHNAISSNSQYQNSINSPYTISQEYVNQPSVISSSYSQLPSNSQKPYETPNTINPYSNQVSQKVSLYTNNGQYNVNSDINSYSSSNVPIISPPAPKTYTYVPPQKPTAAPQVQITPAPIYSTNNYNSNPSNYNVPSHSSSTNYNYQNIGVRQNNNVQPVIYPNNPAFNGVLSSNNQQVNNVYSQSVKQPIQNIVYSTQSPIKIETTTTLKETNSYIMESNLNPEYPNNLVTNYIKSTEKEDSFYVPDDQKSIYENVEEDNYEKSNSLPSQGNSYKNSSEVEEDNNDITSQTSIAALTQQIKRLPAVFYADSRDPNTQRIERMLRDTYGLPLVTFYLDKIDDTNTVEKNLQTLTAHTGTPYLFICGTFIGSQQHIDNYKDSKQIPQLVEYVCGDQKHRHRSKRHDNTISFPKVMWTLDS
uniref:Glutaredoxin domain-containing protein n=1 Tax=Strongyloides venezuelensis TaxID=75913 RepID=A0A0K0F871_STRVS